MTNNNTRYGAYDQYFGNDASVRGLHESSNHDYKYGEDYDDYDYDYNTRNHEDPYDHAYDSTSQFFDFDM